MFYAKTMINGEISKVAITHTNVFAICPGCRKEIAVDLSEIFKGENKGLYATAVLCPECKKSKGEMKNE